MSSFTSDPKERPETEEEPDRGSHDEERYEPDNPDEGQIADPASDDD